MYFTGESQIVLVITNSNQNGNSHGRIASKETVNFGEDVLLAKQSNGSY